ncbi:MAG TPA: nucleotidyltransferase, partial [Anaerohalosphaeraceae bacterium]|nr:nucleotidyltransferase [Anaerohalosphaeraceae bacterium]
MAIPESQLETWAKQGAITTAKSTADSVKNALNSYNNWPNGIDFEVYLQGSYKNDTNIRGDSDVDIVAQLNSTFYSNLSVLSIVVDYSLCRASILP